jgi:hypothetical protein
VTTMTIDGRIDRAMERMRSEGFKARLITLGLLEQAQLKAVVESMLPTIVWTGATTAEDLATMKYKGVAVACVDEPSRLKVEGVWVDPVCEAEDLLPPVGFVAITRPDGGHYGYFTGEDDTP